MSELLDSLNGASPQNISDRERIRAIMAGSIGSLIEWYDFYVYAFTALYFAPAFFPSGDRTAQLLDVAGIYASGFLIRPLGAWFFGRYADRHGRKAGIVYCVLLMGAGSLLVGVLPTHASIGNLAPACLLFARLLQGFSTGGQYGSAATYLAETPTEKSRGFFSSFQYVTLIAGQLGALTILLLLQSILSDTEIRAWGWRIPFILGFVLAATILILRHQMRETISTKGNIRAGNLRELARHPRSLFIVTTISGAGALVLYTFTTYMQKFLVNTTGLSISAASKVMTGSLLVFMIVQPLMGAISDRFGRRLHLMLFGGLMTVAAVPLLSLASRAASPLEAFFIVTSALLILSFYSSISGLFKSELFPVHVRALGVGLAHNIATAALGGTAELLALFAKQQGHEDWFYTYVAIVAAIAFFSATLIKPRPTALLLSGQRETN
jgi:MHS family alpha-ketoglutarate permease-like MFS transporter